MLSITMPQSVDTTAAPFGAPAMARPSVAGALRSVRVSHALTVVRFRKTDGDSNGWPLSPLDGPSG